ncbi:DUF4160 domain-containing protein [Pseudoduganella sp. LjRoot289]|uniref:DUF4160 domain-containing protein n=1 Tax=Pseudoduganella sp. LjRoot289 TaxID=3342314 RepID=UPI003ED094A0
MPTISCFYGMLIQMFFRDHLPPHFHVKYGEFKAVIDIQQLTVHDGYLPQRALRIVLDWAKLHKTELLENWQLCQALQSPKPIPPLE